MLLRAQSAFGLSGFVTLFEKEEVDLAAFELLEESHLRAMRICDPEDIRLVLQVASELRRARSLERQALHTLTNDDDDGGGGGGGNNNSNDADADAAGGASVTAKRRTGCITDFFSTTKATRLSKGLSATVSANGPSSGGKPSAGVGAAASLRPLPTMRIPGTRFLVDAFRCRDFQCDHWFLTHFHSDHYGGLTKGFAWTSGVIHCSPITARLVTERIGVAASRLRVHEVGEVFQVQGVSVVFLDANHCPGAVMILFMRSPSNCVLHTGDFRYSPRMREYPWLSTCRVSTLILDTTYCDPQYDFPPQEQVTDFVVDAIRAEKFNPRTLFLMGSYTIGKERIFLEVARRLGTQVYVGQNKFAVLQALSLPREYQQLITTDDSQAHIHVVPMGALNFKRMQAISQHYRGRFSSVVAFAPTGWSMTSGGKPQRDKRNVWMGTRLNRGTLVKYEVPYSEHSSFAELKQFVSWLQPVEIRPHVNAGTQQKRARMLRLLRG